MSDITSMRWVEVSDHLNTKTHFKRNIPVTIEGASGLHLERRCYSIEHKALGEMWRIEEKEYGGECIFLRSPSQNSEVFSSLAEGEGAAQVLFERDVLAVEYSESVSAAFNSLLVNIESFLVFSNITFEAMRLHVMRAIVRLHLTKFGKNPKGQELSQQFANIVT